jgi:hypothetical protein
MVYHLEEMILTLTADAFTARSSELALESNLLPDLETPALQPAP